MKRKTPKSSITEVRQIRDQLVLLQQALQQANGHLGRLIKLLLKR